MFHLKLIVYLIPVLLSITDKYILLCRVEMPIGRSSLVIAESKMDYNFKVADKTNSYS